MTDSSSPEVTERQPTILLIDDEPRLAEFVAQAAELSGFEPTVTSSHEEFRSMVVSNRPDMLALDLGMPDVDGIELLRFLAEHQVTAPVLIISGFDRRVLETAFRLGKELGLQMVGPIEKPARLAELEEIFATLRPTLAT